tara:strand:- start:56 stop:448 length:393 start_codon:yes stop_codon:yes gene_type:complete
MKTIDYRASLKTWSLIASLLTVLSVGVLNAVDHSQGSPKFIQENIHASNQAQVLQILDQSDTSVVMLNDGLEAGFDIGMTASVVRASKKLGTLIIIASEKSHSAALILELDNNLPIRVGDTARLNTFRKS